MDGVERVMVLGIFIVIVLILGVLAWDASNEDPAAALTSGADGGSEVNAASLSEGDPRGELRQDPSLREKLAEARAKDRGAVEAPAQTRGGNRAAQRPGRNAGGDDRVAHGGQGGATPGPSAGPERDAPSSLNASSAQTYLSNSVSTKPEPAAPSITKYTVKEGDTAWGIASRNYGSGDMKAFLDLIQDANPSVDLDQLRVGLVLDLPASAPAEAKLPSPAERAAAGEGRTYKVVDGDTLRGIAASEFGDAGRWQDIYDANRHLISSPSALSVGVTLVLPEK